MRLLKTYLKQNKFLFRVDKTKATVVNLLPLLLQLFLFVFVKYFLLFGYIVFFLYGWEHLLPEVSRWDLSRSDYNILQGLR